jgi:hypothetical protein
MPIESILFLSLVLEALFTFATALAYGERVSGRVPRESTPRSMQTAEPRSVSRPADIATYKKAA